MGYYGDFHSLEDVDRDKIYSALRVTCVGIFYKKTAITTINAGYCCFSLKFSIAVSGIGDVQYPY